MHRHKKPPAPIDVLIAEDDAITRLTLRQLLEGEGYTCAEAEDGREALQIARQCRPRLVLLDLMMPKLDGLQVAREIRADPQTRRVPIHFLTGRTDLAARRGARRAGVEAFLTKPLNFDGLLDVVSIALNSPDDGAGAAP